MKIQQIRERQPVAKRYSRCLTRMNLSNLCTSKYSILICGLVETQVKDSGLLPLFPSPFTKSHSHESRCLELFYQPCYSMGP